MATDETSDFQGTALARRIFADHGLKYGGLWQNTQYTQPALAILKTGIISGRELIGLKNRRYPLEDPADDSVDMPDHLLFDLVRAYLDYFSGTDILYSFDKYFWWMAEIAQLGGVQRRRLEGLWQEWRKKISERLVEGRINLKIWQQNMYDSEPPPPLAHELAKTFLRYVPKAYATDIVAWTNSVLKVLGNEPENENTLRIYVGKLKKAAAQLRGPISITE